MEQCLVNVESLKSEALSTLHKTQTILSQSKAAPVYVVFGANNSGGTASVDGLVRGLVSLCLGNYTNPLPVLIIEFSV